MITIPTHELIGMISDMLPFVDTDKDSIATHCVRIEQSDDTLTMLATNRAQVFRVTWSSENDGHNWGAGSNFSVRISPTDAKAIVSAFKLGQKLDYAVLRVSARIMSVEDNTYRLEIWRGAEEDMWSALTMHVTGRGTPIADNGDAPEPDIHGLINSAAGDDRPEVMLAGLTWSPKLLANLGKVERHGAVRIAHRSSRDGAPVYVKAERLDGIMFPVKELSGERVDILRTGAGVLTIG